jgi:hypothetical protein
MRDWGPSSLRSLMDVILFPASAGRIGEAAGEIRTRQRLGGCLNFITARLPESFETSSYPVAYRHL